MRTALIASALIAAASLVPGGARADVCDEVGAIAHGPVAAGLFDGDLGRARRICGRNEFAVGIDALLVVDTANFYGHIVGGLDLEASWAPHRRVELYVDFEAFRYDSVISAFTSNYLGLGHLALGGSYRVLTAPKVSLGVNARLVLPTAVGLYNSAFPIGVDVGFGGAFVVNRHLRFHAQLSGLFSAAISPGAAGPQGGLALTGGLDIGPGERFRFVFDVVGNFLYRAPLDHLGLSFGLRFADRRRFAFQVGLMTPVAGFERAQVAADLRWSIRLGPIPGSG